ncbi:MAG: ATP-grasp domain-containing protein [Ethanoligenens sp.]
MKTVLITNGQLRKSLCAARSLGEKGIRVIVSEETRMNPTAFSRYCSAFVRSPNAKKEPERYLEWLKRTTADYQCDAVFPMDDDTMDIAVAHADELSSCFALPVPGKESYKKARDKRFSVQLAERSGVPCPRTVLPKEGASLPETVAALGYPLVIKPAESSGSRGIRIVCTLEELQENMKTIAEAYGHLLLQEYIPQGDRYDVCMLVGRDGEVKASFVQKELRHFPLKTGPSTVQQSVTYPELEAYALRMLAALPWFGIIEFEFMVDPRDGVPKFMEINPRFWCSLHTAVAAGVDFPFLLWELACGNKVTPVRSYLEGVTGSWILPGDTLHFLFNKNRFRMDPPFLAGKRHGVSDDILSRRDPLPALGFVLACFRYLFSAEAWQFMFRR